MKKIAILMVMIFVMSLAAYAGPFSDVPFGHWAYDAVSKLVSKGIVKGYPDNTFKGGKNVTRYEIAMIVGRLLGEVKGGASVDSGDLATLEKLTVEFSDELALLGVKVTALEDDAKAVRRDISMIKSELSEVKRSDGNGYGKVNFSGFYKLGLNLQKYDNDSSRHSAVEDRALGDDTVTSQQMAFNIFTNIDENISSFALYCVQSRWNKISQESIGNLKYAYVDIDNLWGIGDLRLGRQNVVLGHGIVVADQMDGVRFDKVIDRVKLSAMAMDNKKDVASQNMTFYPYDMTRTTADLGDSNGGAASTGMSLVNANYANTDDITFFVSPYSWPTVSNVTSNPNAVTNALVVAPTVTNAWNGLALDLVDHDIAVNGVVDNFVADYENADATDVFANATTTAQASFVNGQHDFVADGGVTVDHTQANAAHTVTTNAVAPGTATVRATNSPYYTYIDVDGGAALTTNDMLNPNWAPNRTFAGLIGAGSETWGVYDNNNVSVVSALEAEDANAVANQAFNTQDLSQYQLTDFYGNTVVYDYAGFTKQSAQINDRGFNFMALAVSVDVGGHRLGAYYASNKYSAYDPYTRLGDPFAAISDIDGDGIVWDDLNTSPAARPSWMGLTLDGNILKNLDYFLEYVSFDPDISNVGMTADNIFDANWNSSNQIANEQEPWSNNLKKGKAWLLGIDWDITEKYNIIASYGEGSEEFMILSMDPALAFNGMEGRWNTGIMENVDTRYYANPHSNYGLTGVKDINLKLSGIFNDKTEGFIQFENVSDNDNSAIRSVAGAQDIVGHPVMDYSIITLFVKHQFRPNTSFGLRYTRLNYSEASVDQLQDSGSWDRIRTEIEVRF